MAMAPLCQVDRESRHKRDWGVDTEDGVVAMCMWPRAGEQGQRLGGQLVMLDHQPCVATDITDAGPGPPGAA